MNSFDIEADSFSAVQSLAIIVSTNWICTESAHRSVAQKFNFTFCFELNLVFPAACMHSLSILIESVGIVLACGDLVTLSGHRFSDRLGKALKGRLKENLVPTLNRVASFNNIPNVKSTKK